MEYLPIFLQLKNADVVLVGGGTVAARKANLLLQAGARLTVVAPEISPSLLQQLKQHDGVWREQAYQRGTLQGHVLAVAATPDAAVNEQVFHEAGALSIPINVVDSPALCTFIFPSIVDRSPVVIAISSSGQSPVLARLLRRKIEALIPAAYGTLAAFAGKFRDRVASSLPSITVRRAFWEQVIDGTIGNKVLAGREQQAETLLLEALESASDEPLGEVYLIGAGPGDPDLMTFKAVRLLQCADVILYDRLVSQPILDLSRRDAERIYVGKARADHALPQQDINQLLVDLAQQGKRVVRLKGGDPFIFGRGGEEIELLAKHGIAFQVVPGITAASGAASYSGIPLTHRDYAQSVRFVAGYLKGDRIEHDWTQFQSTTETLVFYMGLAGLPVICRELRAHGRRGDTPIALIERGTLADQRVLIGTLETMDEVVAREQPRAPTLIIVGDVVRLHEELAWFGER